MQDLKKKNTKFTFFEICKFNIDNIKNHIIKFNQEWNIDTSRQDTYITHKNTKVYKLRDSNYYWKSGESLVWKDINILDDEKSQKDLYKIYDTLEKFYNGIVIRSELVNMLPNTKIPKHVDSGDSLYIGRRIHIPIVTNKNIFFSIMNDKINMIEGVAYEINNAMPHSVENNSNQNRVHLIIDIMPKNI